MKKSKIKFSEKREKSKSLQNAKDTKNLIFCCYQNFFRKKRFGDKFGSMFSNFFSRKNPQKYFNSYCHIILDNICEKIQKKRQSIKIFRTFIEPKKSPSWV